MMGDHFRADHGLRALGSAAATKPPRTIIDIAELGVLRRLERGDLADDGTTDCQHDTLIRLGAKKLAEFGEHGFPGVRLTWRITGKGREALK